MARYKLLQTYRVHKQSRRRGMFMRCHAELKALAGQLLLVASHGSCIRFVRSYDRYVGTMRTCLEHVSIGPSNTISVPKAAPLYSYSGDENILF